MSRQKPQVQGACPARDARVNEEQGTTKGSLKGLFPDDAPKICNDVTWPDFQT